MERRSQRSPFFLGIEVISVYKYKFWLTSVFIYTKIKLDKKSLIFVPMNPSFLPPDDSPRWISSNLDLYWEFNEVVSRLFYDSCDNPMQKLLSKCGWNLTSGSDGLTLVLICPKKGLTWQVLKSLDTLSEKLQSLGQQAKIRIYPPPTAGSPMEVLVM